MNTQLTLEAHRATWLEQEQQLIQHRGKYGYPGIQCADEFLALPMDMSNGQSWASQFLVTQDLVREHLTREFMLWPEECVVRELNKKHAVIHTSQFYILTEKENLMFGGKDFDLESKQSLRNMYENKQIQCLDGKMRSKADIWLKSPLRKELKDIVFKPHQKTPGCYNLWQGFAKTPAKGDSSRYWEHVLNIICSRNPETYRYVRKWLACVFQHPEGLHTSLVLCGGQGVGKNSFVEPLGVLLGGHYVLTSSLSELTSNFNAHLKNAILIHANESVWGGNIKEVGLIKARITEKINFCEPKGQDRFVIPNLGHIIFSSNEAWPLHLDPDDRRFLVIHVSDERKEDHAYFSHMRHELEHGGYEALLYDLLHEDLNGFNPHAKPNNDDSFDIKMRSAQTTDRYIFSVLSDGYFYTGNDHPATEWGDISKDLLYEYYVVWCRDSGERTVTKAIFCKRVLKLIPSMRTYRPGNKGPRPNRYRVPTLQEGQEEFCKAYKVSNEIWDEDNEDGLASDESGYPRASLEIVENTLLELGVTTVNTVTPILLVK